MVGAFGEVQVMDWGLAKVLSAHRPPAAADPAPSSVPTSVVETVRTGEPGAATHAGAVLGTYDYMPPEQARGEVGRLDERCDVFGLGAILCEVLTGKPPYTGTREEVKFQAQLGHVAPALERLEACAADRELVVLARSCLSARPEERPAHAGVVAAAVAAHQAEVQERLRRAELDRAAAAAREEEARATAAARAREEEAKATAAAERRARRRAVALVVALAAGIGVTAYYFLRERDQAEQAAQRADEALQARQEAEAQERTAREERRRADEARDEAETQKDTAQEERRCADEARAQAETLRDRAEWVTYANQMALAHREWEANNVAGARDSLEATRWDYRGWEYRFLSTLFPSNQRTFRGHTDNVTGVAFSPDGTRLVSGSFDQTLRVWDVGTGREALALQGHTDGVTCVAFSPDSERLVSGGYDRTLRAWDAQTGREVLTLKGHRGSVRRVTFSPDGRRIASGGDDQTLRVWNAESGQEVLALKGHTGPVRCVAFSPDGKRLASGSTDQTLRVWLLPND
jgi:hypothetical protein